MYIYYISMEKVSQIVITNKDNYLQLSQVQVMNTSGENVALTGTVTSSGVWQNSTTVATERKAIDGVLRARGHPDEYHSRDQRNNYWILTLRTPQYIRSVTIYNRADCCADRLSTGRLELKKSDGSIIYTTPLTSAAVQTYNMANQYDYVSKVAIYNNDNYLQLSQVQVMNTSGENVALTGTVTSSGIWDNSSPAERAIDGDLRARGHPYEYHSRNKLNNNWILTLRTPQYIRSVTIYNRADCCADRLRTAVLYLMNSSGTTIYSTPLTSAAVQTYTLSNRCDYVMSNTELTCYKNRYPELASYNNPQLQNHWATIGCKQNRNNQCPSPQTNSGLYKYKGCYNDTGDRAIPTYRGNVSNVNQCQNLATQNGDTVMGLQYYGQCWTGKDETKAYKYGANNNGNLCGNMGQAWTQNVYVRTLPFPPPVPPIPILSSPNFSEKFSNMLEEDISYQSNIKYISIIILFILIFLMLYYLK